MSLEIVMNTSKIRPRIGEVIRVLNRGMVKDTPLEGYIGFGTPRVVLHPDTLEPWLLFTAWNDVNGMAREIWAAPIKDEETLELDLAKAKRIATGTDAGVDGLNTVDPVWDDYNEEWLLFSTVYPTSTTCKVTITDKDFNKKEIQNITTTIDPTDGGISGIPLMNKSMLVSYGGNAQQVFAIINDITQRPLTLTQVGPSRIVPPYAARVDVHKLFTVNRQLLMLAELRQYTRRWTIALYFGPDKDYEAELGDTDPRGRFLLAFSLRMPLAFSHDYDINHIGHPEYVSVTKRPALMFATFENWNVGGTRAWAHSIYAVFIPHDYFANIREWLPAVAGGGDGDKGYPIFTGGARKIMVLVKLTASGNVTIQESDSPISILNGSPKFETTESITDTNWHKIIIEDPLPYIAVTSDVTLNGFYVYLLP